MGILSKLRRHAAVSSGNFASMFKDVEIPPLPAAVTRLVAEINKPEPDIDRLAGIISSTPGIAVKVIKTVNSTLFGLRRPVSNVKHAITLLGFKQIRTIALAFATMDSLPKPESDLFDHEAFWTDSLLQAMLSRSFSKKRFAAQSEDVFTASLLEDVALPVLLCAWREYYEPVIEEWRLSAKRLSEIEREHFGWDHAQAGAWILRLWEFPEEMVCYVGAHNLIWDEIIAHELNDTMVAPMAVAALSSSVLKAGIRHAEKVFGAAIQWLSMNEAEFMHCVLEAKTSLSEVLGLFGVQESKAGPVIDELSAVVDNKHGEEEI
jgi:HD-like signal output (HDOD) protein